PSPSWSAPPEPRGQLVDSRLLHPGALHEVSPRVTELTGQHIQGAAEVGLLDADEHLYRLELVGHLRLHVGTDGGDEVRGHRPRAHPRPGHGRPPAPAPRPTRCGPCPPCSARSPGPTTRPGRGRPDRTPAARDHPPRTARRSRPSRAAPPRPRPGRTH